MKVTNIRVLITIIVIGLLAGMIGIVLTELLHVVQQLAFGTGNSTTHTSFKILVETSTPLHRLLVVLLCGVLTGLGWVLLHRYGSGITDIKKVVQNNAISMPIGTMILHPILQIITVALGSPLGREVAPREMSVALTTGWLKWTNWNTTLDSNTKRVLLACAAGAGLAAVYNAPLSSTIFILETLLLSWSMHHIIAALLSCSIATFVVRMGLGDTLQYPLSSVSFTDYLIIWAALMGIFIGISVHYFNKSFSKLSILPRTSWYMIPLAIVSFGIIGIMSIYFPEILGNGKPGVYLAFTTSLDWSYAVGLFATKWGALLLATIAGAYGGRISPSMMLGSLLAFIGGSIWNSVLPLYALPLEVCTVVGAATFLGCAQKMHLTAIIFLLELSRFSPSYFFPICICMGTSMIIVELCNKKSL